MRVMLIDDKRPALDEMAYLIRQYGENTEIVDPAKGPKNRHPRRLRPVFDAQLRVAHPFHPLVDIVDAHTFHRSFIPQQGVYPQRVESLSIVPHADPDIFAGSYFPHEG